VQQASAGAAAATSGDAATCFMYIPLAIHLVRAYIIDVNDTMESVRPGHNDRIALHGDVLFKCSMALSHSLARLK